MDTAGEEMVRIGMRRPQIYEKQQDRILLFFDRPGRREGAGGIQFVANLPPCQQAAVQSCSSGRSQCEEAEPNQSRTQMVMAAAATAAARREECRSLGSPPLRRGFAIALARGLGWFACISRCVSAGGRSDKIRKLEMSLLSNFARRARSRSYNTILSTKWMWDRFSLPLRSEHYNLYRTIHRYYFDALRQFPNLRSCSTFNEKIQWLKLFDQDPEIVRCTDKLTARDYVSNRVGSEFLVKLLQAPSSFDEINFDKLPNSFVLKTNHDSGTAVLVRDKSSLDRNAVRSKITTALRRIYGQEKGEWSYGFIKPRILVEQFLSPDGNIPPADYKFHCVDGKVRFLQYIYDRGMGTKEQILDIDANPLPIHLDVNFRVGSAFRKPAGWHHLIDVAERIATSFKYVRVDLYYIDSKIFFGEMTFWPYGGFYLGKGQALLGRYLDFDRSSTKAPIFTR